MSRKTALLLMFVLTAFNVGMIMVDISKPSQAAVGGKSYQALMHDADFARAVKAIVTGCKVNVDVANITC
jgi:acyl-CoA reductase-like NAD-dependent aldehyde dehydrogenase